MAKRKRPEDKKHPGRGDVPSESEIAERVKDVCKIISSGLALYTACEQIGICTKTFYEWMSVYDWIAPQYTRAKQDRAEAQFDKLEEIELKVLSGEINPNAGRVVIDSMKWRLGKMHGKYSDLNHHVKVEHNISVDLEDRLNRAKAARRVGNNNQGQKLLQVRNEHGENIENHNNQGFTTESIQDNSLQ